MKHLVIFLLAFVLGLGGYAAPVDINNAKMTAQSMLGCVVNVRMSSVNQPRKAHGTKDFDAPAYYVFTREEGNGFVIVSGDDVLPALVAYSYQTSFPADGVMPPALSDYLDAYASLVDAVRGSDAVMASARRTASALPVVEPLCKTKWDQKTPYNMFCPQIGEKRCPVGCVALAMAQIMKYFEWPTQGTGKVTYTPSNVKIPLTVDFSQSAYQWDAMLNTTTELKNNEDAARAVAKLCYDCGVSARMEYDVDASASYDDYAIQSMCENFGYKGSTMRILYRDCFAKQQEWYDILKAELDAGRPVLYGGLGSDVGGHEFVVDGYDSNDFFHVNWGWGGSYDAYFDINVLDATPTMSFSESQSMIVGMEPDYAGTDRVLASVVPYLESSLSIKNSISLGRERLVRVTNIYNRSRSAQTWFFGMGLFDMDGNMVANLTIDEKSQSISSMKGLAATTVSFSIPSDTPNGEYVLSLIFRPKNLDDWLLPNVVGGAQNNRVYVRVHDGVADVYDMAASIYNICINGDNADNAEVVSHQYFDMSGLPCKKGTKGYVLDIQTLSNGEKRVRKVLF